MAENAVKGEMNQSKDIDKDGARSKQMSDRELTVREIIEDLQAIEQELHAYERKYSLVPFQHDYDACHCEERSDEAIPSCAKRSVSHENVGIASLRSQWQICHLHPEEVLASVVFYELYCQGKLDDDGYELTEDLGMWAGAYEIKLDRERRFLELSREYQLHPSQLAFRDPRDRANRSRRKNVKAAV
jgi:hypothetical protein